MTETMMKSRKKRSTRPQTDETKRTSGKRESGMGTITSKQTDETPAPANRQQARSSPDPEGGGLLKASKPQESRGEGAGRKEKEDKRIRGHEHLIISSPDIPASSKHRTMHTSRRPRRIASEPFPSPSPSYLKQ